MEKEKGTLVVHHGVDDRDKEVIKVMRYEHYHIPHSLEPQEGSEKIEFTIPKNIPDAEMIAKRVCHSLARGDYGYIYTGCKVLAEDGKLIYDDTRELPMDEAVKHIRLSLMGLNQNKLHN